MRLFWCPLPLCFGEALVCLGGGDVEYFENYSFLVEVEGIGNPRARSLPILGREADGGTWICGVGGKGVSVCTCGAVQRAGTPGTFTGQPSRAGTRQEFLAVAMFVFWALRDSVLAPNGCSPFPKFYFIFPMAQAL
uniref:Secreted protein n=1 Tax=Rousettus aegyptiacus TaxID=9407 RepID=A0A7J8HRT8_ROUAE|nr:hypothetical protein HJG63_010941 [Rousettus aegyptiacus]